MHNQFYGVFYPQRKKLSMSAIGTKLTSEATPEPFRVIYRHKTEVEIALDAKGYDRYFVLVILKAILDMIHPRHFA